MAKGELTIVLDEKDLQKMNALLSEYDKVDQSAIIQHALKQGMQVIVDEGKSNLAARNKKKTGNLARSFKMTTNKKKAYSLGGFKRGKDGGAHAHMIDRGTDKRYTLRPYTDKLGRTYPAGMYRGSISRGNPNHGSGFWSDAVATKGQEGLGTLMNAIYQAIDEINKKNS